MYNECADAESVCRWLGLCCKWMAVHIAGSVMNALASWLSWMMQRVVFMRSFSLRNMIHPVLKKYWASHRLMGMSVLNTNV
ncbi:hypothetical protein [Vibrio sp. Hep-1b-8]|uniref:hypothetical protein n=1 Tax=Vibrio sp. Hep-1b-8 TaxID=2144187 RepID=UPI00111081B3|nr:hypothetical protein [Vibrio sp. Hep-1b-8]